MSRVRDVLPNQDLSDVEMGSAYRLKCFNCGCKQDKAVKVITVTDTFGETFTMKTQNETGVCTNKACFRYTDQSQTPSWVRIPRA